MSARTLVADYASAFVRQLAPLERSFFVVVLALGLCVLFLANSLVQESHYELSRQYLAAREAFQDRRGRDMTDFQALMASLTAANTSAQGPRQRRTTTPHVSPPHPATGDPAWMGVSPPPAVHPFQPQHGHSHPFLRGYVLENPRVCGNHSVDLLIVIHSAAGNFQRRRVLRETWAATSAISGLSVRRVFVLGRNASDVSGQVRVNTEQAVFGDVVQGDFADSFDNLTVKAVTALRWVNDHCPHARFVLKADDDMFVNVFLLAERLLGRLAGERRTLLCHKKANNTSPIFRVKGSRWFVPPHLLPGHTHWPTFCSGYLVVMTTDVVPALYGASFSVPPVPVDDAYVYGLLPLQLPASGGLTYRDLSPNLTLSQDALLTRAQRGDWSLVAGAVKSELSLVRLWQAALKSLSPWARTRARVTRLRDVIAPSSS